MTQVVPGNEVELLFETLAGSRLYNTHTPTSDMDRRGVYLEHASNIIGIGGEPKVQRGAEGADDDWELQPLRKFTGLAIGCSPNILDTLFAPRDKWLHSTPAWEQLYAIRHAFLNERARRTFISMAMNHLNRCAAPSGRIGKSSRVALFEQFGFDVKDAANTVRLLLKAHQMITTLEYNPALDGNELLMVKAVRAGEVSYANVLAWANERLPFLERAPSQLPAEADMALIERTLMGIYREHLVASVLA